MSDQNENDPSGGVAAHLRDEEAPRTYAVAPTISGRMNTIRPSLRPHACWRMDDLRFDFDSSFILPTATREFALLARTRPPSSGETGESAAATGLLMSVFGHADPTGSDDYNKVLSCRRAVPSTDC